MLVWHCVLWVFRSCCPCTWVCCGGSWWVLGFVFCCWCAYGTGTPCSRACRSCSSSERCTAGCRTRCTAQVSPTVSCKGAGAAADHTHICLQRGLESWRRGMLDVTRWEQQEILPAHVGQSHCTLLMVCIDHVCRSNQRIEMKRSLERKRRSRAAGLRLKMTLICVCFHLMVSV